MTTGIVRVGRWRLELSAECWRVRRRGRVVLWGGRPGEVQLGSREDRLREIDDELMRRISDTLWGGFSVLTVEDMRPDMAVVVSGWSLRTIHDVGEDVQPFAKFSRLGPAVDRQWREAQASPERDAADDEKLRAYSGARGWSPEDGDQA